jgi:hypothetical protein
MQGKDSAAEVLKPSLADMAAVSIEMWSGLEHTGSSADVSLETAKEAAALRFLLLEERKRVKNELRPLKHAWETAEHRASGLEYELLLVRCTQSLLSKEIGEADALSSWWRGQYTAARRDVGVPARGQPLDRHGAVGGGDGNARGIGRKGEPDGGRVEWARRAAVLHLQVAHRTLCRRIPASQHCRTALAHWPARGRSGRRTRCKRARPPGMQLHHRGLAVARRGNLSVEGGGRRGQFTSGGEFGAHNGARHLAELAWRTHGLNGSEGATQWRSGQRRSQREHREKRRGVGGVGGVALCVVIGSIATLIRRYPVVLVVLVDPLVEGNGRGW